jgi:hypothetical protein
VKTDANLIRCTRAALHMPRYIRSRFDHFLQRAKRTDNFRVVYGKEETSVKTSARPVNRFNKRKTKEISETEADVETTFSACKETGGIRCGETG